MPTAKKLPSGNWKVRIYDYTDDQGKQHMKSFTAATKKEAERMAAQYAGTRQEPKLSLTLGEAIDLYIDNRKSVLSPATVATYRQQRNHYCQPIMKRKLATLTNEHLQKAINAEAPNVSPKTIRNIYGLICAAIKAYRPDFVPVVKLPQKVRPNLIIPTDQQIRDLLTEVSGTKMELPILLAALGPMRRGEICALRYENIKGNTVHVCENMVKDENKQFVVKTTKSYAGDRFIVFPDIVAKRFTGTTGRVCDVTPDYISHTWQKLKKRHGIDFRFHDLRHYCASILHTMMPDQYIMARGGWSTDITLKQVYRHTLSDQAAAFNAQANNYFEQNLDPNLDPNKK